MSSSTSFRRYASVLLLGLSLLVSGCSGAPGEADQAGSSAETAASSGTISAAGFADEMERLEQEYDARVGVSMIDVEEGEMLSYQGDERFGFASTMKAFAAVELLDSTTADERDELVRWTSEDVEAAGYAPVTEQAVESGMTLGELAEAAVRESDNTAMNLVLEHLGGPQGLQRRLEDAGDSVSRPVDVEPALNDVVAGDAANTSTSEALAENLARVAAGERLEEDDHRLFMEWMSSNPTGDTLIRAGAPEDWEVAEKSGGGGAIRNDVAVVRPPEGGPIVLVVLTERHDVDEEYEDALVADIAGVALAEG